MPMLCYLDSDHCLFVSLDNGQQERVEFSFAEMKLADLKKFLAANEPALRSVVLSFSSRLCFAESTDPGSLNSIGNRQELIYELENYIPFAAEEMVADFVICKPNALGVAVEAKPFLQLVEAIEVCDYQILSISPASLLALQSFLSSRDSPAEGVVAFVDCGDEEFLDLFLLRQGFPIRWASCRQCANEINQQIDGWKLIGCEISEVFLVGESFSLEDSDFDRFSDRKYKRVENKNSLELAKITAERILEEKTTSLVELRRERLSEKEPHRHYRRAALIAMASMLFFAACVSGKFFFQARVLADEALELRQAQVQCFADQFPEKKIPKDIRSRLESMDRQLRGQKDRSLAEATLDHVTLITLQKFLNSLDTSMRFRVDELNLELNNLRLRSELRNRSDIQTLVKLLKKQGFAITNMPTTAQSNSVDATIDASWREDELEVQTDGGSK